MSMKKRVCIIGAGPAGLYAAKRCLDAVQFDVSVFEQTDQLGGTWVYCPETNVHSSMYEKMSTNIPREVMAFPEVPFPESDRSFIPHQEVLQYLQRFGSEFEEIIKYNTKVVTVKRANSGWDVTIDSADSGTTNLKFDIVFVANGHYSCPRIPEFAESLHVPWIHSHDYRSASVYAEKTVVVAGAGPSGIDIALQIGQKAKKVYLCHNAHDTTKLEFPKQINIVPGLRGTSESGKDLLLSDGTTLSNVDAVVLCTGYKFDFPFLSKDLVQTPLDGSYISPLFAHTAHVQYPESLFFLGMNITVVPFILYAYQLDLALALINGRAAEIGLDTIQGWEKVQMEKLAANGIPSKYYHNLAEKQWDFFKELANFAGTEYRTPEVLRAIYDAAGAARKVNVATYKRMNFEVSEDGSFKIVDSGLSDFD
uniref:Flavin-containing monooxygenase n=1 Tax=Panagrellus redivivus TaxID=6233 RepID=A0A7E4UP27_PANRE